MSVHEEAEVLAGPWEVRPETNGVSIVCAANGWTVATIMFCKGTEKLDRTLANLIAATPELYRMVKFIHDWCEENKWSSLPYPGTLVGEDYDNDKETLAMAVMAAVDKAEGR